MKRASDLERPGAPPKVVYADLDGTLVGPGGSLFASATGSTRRAADAVAALHEMAIPLVPVSGRMEAQAREAARMLGAAGFVAELGGVAWTGDEIVRDYGEYRGDRTPHREMVSSGAAPLLLERYAGRLEPHAPWAFEGREVTMLFRGLLDADEATAALHRAGYGWLRVVDNGRLSRTFPGLHLPEVHAYHLAPGGVSKAQGVASDLRRRGLRPEDAIAVGDAVSDAAVASQVGAAFVVANGRAAVEASGFDAPNLYATEASHGEGFAEAVGIALGLE